MNRILSIDFASWAFLPFDDLLNFYKR